MGDEMSDPKDNGPGPEGASPRPGGPGPETSPPVAAPRARMSRGLRLLLFTSLALNLAVAGLVAGFVLRAPFDGPPPRPDRVAGALTFALSDQDRREIGRSVFRELRNDGVERRSRRDDYARILGALRAEPFDVGEVESVLSAQLQDSLRFQSAGQRALLDHVAGMSAEDRRAFADRLEEGLARFDARNRDGHDRDDHDRMGPSARD